ncbi:hypothetical protein MKZ38_007835 [Zalerion maritima]|uniref:Uncharacterized protein n=1 Tax=Zalerion maritima TaxID=339359 RepID=A0AAD5RID9_9PEZI|nr:hypothetical protein MKZ38_007835 [Zalerion maritima]
MSYVDNKETAPKGIMAGEKGHVVMVPVPVKARDYEAVDTTSRIKGYMISMFAFMCAVILAVCICTVFNELRYPDYVGNKDGTNQSLVVRDGIVPSQFIHGALDGNEVDVTVGVTETISPIPETGGAVNTGNIGTPIPVDTPHTWSVDHQNETTYLTVWTGTGTGVTSSATAPMFTTGTSINIPGVPDITPVIPSTCSEDEETDSSTAMGISGTVDTTVISTTIKTVLSSTKTSTHTVSVTEKPICEPEVITVTVTASSTPVATNPVPGAEVPETSSETSTETSTKAIIEPTVFTTIYDSSAVDPLTTTTIWDNTDSNSLIPITETSAGEVGSVGTCTSTGTGESMITPIPGNSTTTGISIFSTTTFTSTTTLRASGNETHVTATAGAVFLKLDSLSVVAAALPVAFYFL